MARGSGMWLAATTARAARHGSGSCNSCSSSGSSAGPIPRKVLSSGSIADNCLRSSSNVMGTTSS
jgi:hypothetical protein